jgi:hypothetical protein
MHANLTGMNPLNTLKLIFPTLLFYAIGIGTCLFLHKIDRGGPCVPGWGAIVFFLFLPVAISLMLRNIILALRTDKRHGIPAVLHAVILITLFLIIYNS